MLLPKPGRVKGADWFQQLQGAAQQVFWCQLGHSIKRTRTTAGLIVTASNEGPRTAVFPKRSVISGRRRPGVLTQTQLGAALQETGGKVSIPLRWQKKKLFRLERRCQDDAGNFSPPRSRIRLIFSRPSCTFTVALPDTRWVGV